MKSAFIFPAFITEYTNKELDFLQQNNVNIDDYMQVASDITGLDLPTFSYFLQDYRKDELYSQIAACMFSCAISDVLYKRGIKPELTAGYSMGIYANLYSVKAVSIENAIKIIFEAYKLVTKVSNIGSYGMGAVIGLGYADLEKIINGNKLKVEIINTNNNLSLVVAGDLKDVELLLVIAKDEGAFTAVKLTVNTPYHSNYLKPCANTFEKILDGISFYEAQYPIVSTYDQRIFTSVEEIKKELVYNLTQKINWHKTMNKIINEKMDVFYECGAGKDLTKIARFIDGDYKIKSIYKIK